MNGSDSLRCNTSWTFNTMSAVHCSICVDIFQNSISVECVNRLKTFRHTKLPVVKSVERDIIDTFLINTVAQKKII